jgi:hypothetical protein
VTGPSRLSFDGEADEGTRTFDHLHGKQFGMSLALVKNACKAEASSGGARLMRLTALVAISREFGHRKDTEGR